MKAKRILQHSVVCATGLLLMAARTAESINNPYPHASPRRTMQGAVAGTVFDSLSNRPLANAFVQILSADGSVVLGTALTNRQGRFRVTAPGSGPVLVGAMHPLLDSLGTSHIVRRTELTPRVDAEVALGVPTLSTLRARWCGNTATDDSLGVLLGSVAPRMPVVDTVPFRVEARWTDLVVTDRAVIQRLTVLEVMAASDGRFVLCGIPRNRPVALFATAGRDSTKARLLTTSDRGFDRVDLSVTSGGLDGTYTDIASLTTAGVRGATRLDTVRVRAKSDLYTPWYDARAFEGRRRRGFGVFLGPDEIERRNPMRVGDLLTTIPSVRVSYSRYGDASIQMISTSFKPAAGGPVLCTPTFWIDGGEVDVEMFRSIANPPDILAMEIYPRAYMTPPQFVSIRNTGSLECGSVVMWTGKRPSRKLP